MRVNKDEVAHVRRVNVIVDGSEVASLVCDRVAVELGLDCVMAANYLNVEFNDRHGAYVRGEVPLTREQQLEALGLTPTEPVETQGAAVAEALSDESTFKEAAARSSYVEELSSDDRGVRYLVVVGPDETVETVKRVSDLFKADEGRAPRYTTLSVDSRPLDGALDKMNGVLKTLERLRAVVGDATGPEAETKIREMVRKQMEDVRARRGPSPAVVEYSPGAEPLRVGVSPELVAEIDSANLQSQADKIRGRLSELNRQNDEAPVWGAAVGARLEEIRELEAELRRLEEPVVPRPEPQDSVGRTRRRTLLKLADRLLQEVLLTDGGMSDDTRLVVKDVEQELRRMSR